MENPYKTRETAKIKDDLEQMNKFATDGVWCQYHPYYCSDAVGSNCGDWDSSHGMSTVKDGKRYRLGEWKHANDAEFAQTLVNAYRAGRLEVKEATE